MRHAARLKKPPANLRRPDAARRSRAFDDKTWIQFPAAGETLPPRGNEAPHARRCPTCHQRFSSDGRFCPFDASELAPAEDWDPRADPLIGNVVDDRYEILDVIGEGGMGTVYLAKHTKLGRRFALKALRRDLATDPMLSARFIQEARAAAAVEHPNVVQIIDFGKLTSGQVYFVMEYLEGRSLSWLIRNGGPIPAARAVAIVRRVAQALAAAHAENIVHRDLKPDNIHIADRLGESELVKVLDFGLARLAGQTRLTRDGVVFGTPHYMSPEQAMGEEVDQRTDIYALGVVMYEMFTGCVPFEADSYMGVLTKHMYIEPTPPSRLMGDSADLGALEDMTLRCLEKRPARRYSSMVHFLAELDRIAKPNPGGGISVRASTRSRSHPSAARELDPTPSRAGGLESRARPRLGAVAGVQANEGSRRGARVVAGGVAACGAVAMIWALLGPWAPTAEPEGVLPSPSPKQREDALAPGSTIWPGLSARVAGVAVPTEPIELLPLRSGSRKPDELPAAGAAVTGARGSLSPLPREVAAPRRTSPTPVPQGRVHERQPERTRRHGAWAQQIRGEANAGVAADEERKGSVRKPQPGGNEIIDPWGQ